MSSTKSVSGDGDVLELEAAALGRADAVDVQRHAEAAHSLAASSRVSLLALSWPSVMTTMAAGRSPSLLAADFVDRVGQGGPRLVALKLGRGSRRAVLSFGRRLLHAAEVLAEQVSRARGRAGRDRRAV